jgi:4'-phosphopantetheinyl transferase
MMFNARPTLADGFSLRPIPVCPSGIGLWLVDVTSGADMRDWQYLSDDERDRASRFLKEADRRRYIVIRASLRALLGAALGVKIDTLTFDYGAAEKPFLRDYPALEFNVSHAGAHGLIALSGIGAVGVDIDSPRPDLDVVDLAREFFSPMEYELVAKAAATMKVTLFFRLWTCKEALAKAAGHSITRTIDVALPDLALDTLLQSASINGGWQSVGGFWLSSVLLPQPYVGALALRGVPRPEDRVTQSTRSLDRRFRNSNYIKPPHRV